MKVWSNTKTLDGYVDEIEFTNNKEEANVALLGAKAINLSEFPKLIGIFRAGVSLSNIPLEEAKKRDHIKLGKSLDLIMMHHVAPGMPFFLPKGMIVLKELIEFVRKESYGDGYNEVRTPQILSSELWKTSGHWEHYKEDMFCIHHAEDDMEFGVKPMNCPAHMLIFKRDVRSYKDLPLRIAETSTLYRNERSGTLHGLTRVRSLSQDDTHIFLREDQILDEILILLDKIKRIYKIFDLSIDEVHLSTRPEDFLGEKKVWDRAEENLEKALKKAKIDYKINEGDGAFYGPKIDVKVKDAIGRQWQLATIQLDFQLPKRFKLEYVDEDNKKKTPVVIHRALLGSMERFLGIIIEHFSGKFPTWLSPVQVKILTLNDRSIEFANEVSSKLKDEGIRVETDYRTEKLEYKVREAQLEKVPYMLIIGDKEVENKTIAVRRRDNKVKFGVSLVDFLKTLKEEIRERDKELRFG